MAEMEEHTRVDMEEGEENVSPMSLFPTEVVARTFRCWITVTSDL
jgi:hypothetical protein